ncbi:PAS domain S-box protein [Dongia sp.]|uniref:PAS domain S-box protein n=1 Tax=Dongia sp. TaxID=1977262 RepID=UPI0037503540
MSKDTKHFGPEPTDLYAQPPFALDLGLFRDAFEQAAIAICICSLDGRFRHINPKFAGLLGYTAADLFGRHFQDITHPDDLADSLRVLDQLRAGQSRSLALDKRYLQKTGAVVWVHLTVSIAVTESGEPSCLVVTAEDFTEKELISQRLEASLLRNSDILSSMNDGYLALNGDWVYTDLNDRAAELLGKTRAEMLNRHMWDVFPEARESVWLRRFRLVRETGQPMQTYEYYAGMDRWYAASINPFGDGVSVFFRDMTDLRRNEKALQQRESLLRQGAQLARFGTWVWDITEDRCLVCSDEMAALFGMSVEEYLADRGTLRQMRARIHPEDRPIFDSTVSVGPGDTYSIEFRIANKSGLWRHVREIGRAYREEDGTHVHCIGVSQDITDIKATEFELRHLAEEASQLARLAEEANRAKSDFLASMSHELRTPLNAIIGFSEMLLLEDTLGRDQVKDYHLTIRESGRHLLDLINDILDLAKVEAGRVEIGVDHVDLAAVVTECAKYLDHSARQRSVTIATAIDCPGLRSDRRLVKQILLNLAANAVKFNRPGGRVAIVTRRRGNMVELEVTDTGIGMTEDDLKRVLKPFVQLESAYQRSREGSGLGLSLVDRFARLLGGRLEMRSEPGVGTAACVFLPVEDESGD